MLSTIHICLVFWFVQSIFIAQLFHSVLLRVPSNCAETVTFLVVRNKKENQFRLVIWKRGSYVTCVMMDNLLLSDTN